MKDAVLFLAGKYRSRDLQFYRKLCRGSFLVAVDGGYRFFEMSGIVPHLLIGDLDSLPRKKPKLSGKTELIQYPIEKDTTDSELALDLCKERGFQKIDIIQPSAGELDHLLGNIMLLRKSKVSSGKRTKVRLITGGSSVVVCLKDESAILKKSHGARLSVLPLSSTIRLSCTGVVYEAGNLLVRKGESCGLRNEIVSNQAHIEIKGEALLFQGETI